MKIVKYRKVWFLFSAIIVALSLFFIFNFGLRLSADYTEGTLFELRFSNESVTKDSLSDFLESQALFELEGGSELGAVNVLETLSDSFVMRMKRLNDVDSTAFLVLLAEELGDFDKIQERAVSPTVAAKFKKQSINAIIFVSIMIVAYIAFAFRRVSRGVTSWKLGLAAIVALLHDVIITVGIFALLGFVADVEIDLLFITALLTIMGFSVHDTIVVFDRVRENLIHKKREQSFDDVTDLALNQTMARSINTSVSTLIVLLALLFLGSSDIYWFVFALVIGVIAGTYSSIFLASPLLVVWQNKGGRE
jgi:preprotein translocase subunit SecF